MSIMKYVGESYLCDNCKGYPFQLEKDKEYEVQVQFDGNQYVLNGIPVEDPDGTYWVILNNEQTAIPYSKKCLERKWVVVSA